MYLGIMLFLRLVCVVLIRNLYVLLFLAVILGVDIIVSFWDVLANHTGLTNKANNIALYLFIYLNHDGTKALNVIFLLECFLNVVTLRSQSLRSSRNDGKMALSATRTWPSRCSCRTRCRRALRTENASKWTSGPSR